MATSDLQKRCEQGNKKYLCPTPEFCATKGRCKTEWIMTPSPPPTPAERRASLELRAGQISQDIDRFNREAAELGAPRFMLKREGE